MNQSSRSDTVERVLHVVQTLDPAFGGPARVAFELALTQARRGLDVTIVTARTSVRSLADSISLPGKLVVHELEVRWAPMLYCQNLIGVLRNAIARADVVHVHGAYRLPQTAAAWFAIMTRTALVSRPHGTYDQVLRESRRPGRIVRAAYERTLEFPILRSRSCMVHCTSPSEQSDLQTALPGVTNIAIVGNGVAQPAPVCSSKIARMRTELQLAETDKVFLYLGRITPKKRVDLLVEGFIAAAKRAPTARLILAGYDPESKALGLARRHERITAVGHVDGDEKEALFGLAHAFILTSGGENFGVAALEAAARGIPLVLTRQVAVSTQLGEGCLIAELEVAGIRRAIERMYQLSESERDRMSRAAVAGWRAVGSWEVVAPQIDALYSSAQALLELRRAE